MPQFRLNRVPPLPDLSALNADALADGWRIVKRTIEEYETGVHRFDKPGEVLFYVTADDAAGPIAIGGLDVDRHANDPAVGRVRHIYVHTAHRRHGIATLLLTEILAEARGRFTTLRLGTRNPLAAAFYEAKFGFARLPGDERTTHARPV